MGKSFCGYGFSNSSKLRRAFAAAALGCAILVGGGYTASQHADFMLAVSAANGLTATIQPLIWLGADESTKTEALMIAATGGRTDVVALLLKNGVSVHANGDGALFRAALGGHTDTVQLLIDQGADVNASDGLALQWAAMGGHTKTVTLLLDRGADLHAVNDRALNVAIRYGQTETIAIFRQRSQTADASKPSFQLLVSSARKL
jgi:Ankyrin repeats (3 copies)/Ankyrin repeat